MTDDEGVRRLALAMECPEDRNVRDQLERDAGALIDKAFKPRGERLAMPAAPESNPSIPVLWFDRKGCGPDEMAIQLNPLPVLMDGDAMVSPATLGLMVRAGDLVILGRAMVGGGFQLAHEQVAELHRQLGAWLEANRCRQ